MMGSARGVDREVEGAFPWPPVPNPRSLTRWAHAVTAGRPAALSEWRRRLGPAGVALVSLFLLVLPFLEGDVRPALGIEARQLAGQWVVTSVDQNGVAAHAGARVGDVFVLVDGAEPNTPRRADPGLDLSGTHTWTVRRGDTLLTLHPIPERAAWTSFVEPPGLLAIALVFWGVATFVWLSKPDDLLAQQFFWPNLAIATVLALSPAAENDVVWAAALAGLAMALFPSLFLRFLLRFVLGTVPAGGVRTLAHGLFVGGVVIGGLYVGLGLADSLWYDTVRTALLGALAATFLIALLGLAWVTARSRSIRAYQQVRVVVLGMGVAVVPPTVVWLLPAGLGFAPLVRPQLAVFSAVFLPLSFAYAILRHRLLGIDVVVGRTLVYAVTVALLAGGYVLFLDALDLIGRDGTRGSSSLLNLIFFAALTLTFTPVQNRIRWLIDHLIYRDRYDYALTLQALGAQLASVRPIDEVLTNVAARLAGAMNLTGVAILLRRPDGALAIRGASGDYRDPTWARSLLARAARQEEGSSEGEGDHEGHWIPLLAHGEESGLLYLGPKRSRMELSEQDLSLAATIASQAAVAVANALLVERLQAKVAELELLGDRLLHVEETERKRLAQDLHDGALHTVLDLVRQAEGTVELMAGSANANPELAERLRLLAERGRDAAHELRAICSDLFPSELTHLGLVAALESLAHSTSRDENLTVHFTAASFSAERRLPEPIEDTLYRVAREALANVCRHAAASSAWIELEGLPGQVALRIRDDGRGFVVPSATAALRTGHLGLVSMRERVERLGGELTISSQPGAGTTVQVRVAVLEGVQCG